MFYQSVHLGSSNYFKRESGENFSYPLHLHQSFELILVDEGEMEVFIDGVGYRLGVGESVLIFPNQLHSMESERSRHTLFIFSPRLVQAYWASVSAKLPVSNLLSLTPAARDALYTLSADSSVLALKGALYTAVDIFDRAREYRHTEREGGLLYRIFSYIEASFRGDCTLEAIAAHVGYNTEYISRFFKKRIGIPLHKYVQIKRLNYAGYLLANGTEDTLISCAIESGFTSVRSFNRNFKELYGVTPTEYRKQVAHGEIKKDPV